jgi:septum formation protein
MPPKLILASRSLTRRRLLENAGLGFEALRPSFDEEAGKLTFAHATAAELADELAVGKSISASREHPNALVIGADQTLELEGVPLSKTHSRQEARAQLLRLRGRSHELHSAVACAQDGEVLWRHRQSARLTMRCFSDEFAEAYLRTLGDDVMRSVGGYEIEGLGLQLFEEIEGDYFTVLGLPLLPLLAFLRRQGAIAS